MNRNSMCRRFVVTALAAVFAGLLLQGTAGAQARKPFRVVTTFTVIQDIAQNVAGDKAIVESITKPGATCLRISRTPRSSASTVGVTCVRAAVRSAGRSPSSSSS